MKNSIIIFSVISCTCFLSFLLFFTRRKRITELRRTCISMNLDKERDSTVEINLLKTPHVTLYKSSGGTIA
jgi:hypothetical protein